MNILKEIEDVLETKLNKYRNSGLSDDMMNKLTDVLIDESIAETMFSEATLRGKI